MTNDLISRSALLAAYDATHKGYSDCARWLIEEAPSITPSVPEHMNAFEQAYRNGYEAAKRESEWISVDDATPENSRLVLGLMQSHALDGAAKAAGGRRMRLIDADALRDAFCEHCDRPFEKNVSVEECRRGLCRAMNNIDRAPAVEPPRPEEEEDE